MRLRFIKTLESKFDRNAVEQHMTDWSNNSDNKKLKWYNESEIEFEEENLMFLFGGRSDLTACHSNKWQHRPFYLLTEKQLITYQGPLPSPRDQTDCRCGNPR